MSRSRSWRVPSLRGTLFVMLAIVVAYTAAIAIYLAISAGRAARLAQETQSVAGIFQTLEQRVARGEVATRQTRLLLTRPGPVDRGALDRIRKSITPTERGALLTLSNVPPVMRRSLSRADVRAASVENAVFGAIASLELGDRAAAMTKLGVADSIASWADDHLREAEQLGLADLAGRQNEFGRATSHVVTVVLIWAVLGLLFVPLVAFVWRRRVRLPLERLDHAMDAVADGDLTVQVETRRDDEIGRIAEHFNAMTRVLHQRAELQGRLAAAGELVAGVAHEVNNPLMAIALLAETNLDEASLPEELRADLQQMLRQARRAGKLVAGLLRFVRPGTGTVIEMLDLNSLIRESLDLVSYQFSVDEIEVTQRLDPDVPSVECDGSRVEQVLVNLLSNAVQALRTVPVPRRLTLESRWEDGHVAFAVADNGPGIPAELRTRVFVPFFTTKGSRGTGLGLYISRQIMRELGGDLRVEAVEPRGVRFVATVPAAAAAHPVRAPAPTPNGRAGTLRGARILVVDDEDSVRRPLGIFLERRGAQVLQAADGLDALTKLERYPVDVALLDLRMPRMDGIELYHEIVRVRPDLADRVIFVSGDLQQLERAQNIAVPPERILAKPVDLVEVEERILPLLPAGSESV